MVGRRLHRRVFNRSWIYTANVSPEIFSCNIRCNYVSMEAVFAAFFGFILLGEVLLIQQILGCLLIMTAQQAKHAYRVNSVEL